MSVPPFVWPKSGPLSRPPFASGENPVVEWPLALAFGLAFWASAELAWLLSPRDSGYVAFWLPAGLYTVALQLRPLRAWPWVIGAALAGNAAFDLGHGTPVGVFAGFFAANTAQAVLSAGLMRRFAAPRAGLATLRDFVGFVGAGVVVGPMTGALVGAAILTTAGYRAAFLPAWQHWWFGQGLAVLLLGTTILAWRPERAPARRFFDRPAKVYEAIGLFAGLTGMIVYLMVIDGGLLAPYKSRLLPFALWAGVRFGVRGATALNLWLAGLMTVLTLVVAKGIPAEPGALAQHLTTLQSFLAITALVSLVPAIAVHERDRKVDELRESEGRFRRTLDALPTAAYTCDGAGRITYFNAQAEALWGRRPRLLDAEECFGGSLRFLRPDGTLVPRHQCWMTVALAERRAVPATEVVLERPDGLRRTVLAQASPVLDGTGELLGAVNVLTDVTDQKLARQALIANETLLRQFVQHVPAAVAMFDGEMRYLQVSDRWLQHYHGGVCSLIGRCHYDVVPDVPERWKAVHRRVLAGAVESCEEDAWDRADGTTEWIHWEARPWRRADQQIGGLIMFAQVISERVRMRSALHASEERFRSAMQHSPIGMSLVALDGQLVEVNPALCSISGYSREELLARDIQAITHPEDLAADLAGMRDLLAGRQESYEIQKRYRHKQGHVVWIQLSVSLIRNQSGTPRHFVSQIQDITDQIQAEEQRAKLETQLRQAQKMEAIGTLAGGIAHDFNNILAGVMGNLQLAEIELAPHHAAAPLLQEAMRASRRARDLVARILTFSRRSENRRAPTALAPIIEEAVQLLRATVPATIEIDTVMVADCPLVRCDSARIHQVILNLGGNAAAAMRDRRGRLDITLRSGVPAREFRERHPQVRPNHVVRLTVQDNGHGMSAAVRERIFEPFFTTKGPGEGTGLGLAMVHGIMEDLGGAIVVESEPGVGTVFELFFPACDEPADLPGPAPAGPERTPETPGRGERILVVDDDATVLAVAASILRRHGYRPEAYANAPKALAAFEADPTGFAMVVSDLTMPGLTGVELARRIRLLNPGLPIVVASGYLDERAAVEMESLALAGRLEKPYDVAALLAAVRASLGGERVERALQAV